MALLKMPTLSASCMGSKRVWMHWDKAVLSARGFNRGWEGTHNTRSMHHDNTTDDANMPYGRWQEDDQGVQVTPMTPSSLAPSCTRRPGRGRRWPWRRWRGARAS